MMVQTSTQPRGNTQKGASEWASPAALAAQTARPIENPDGLVKLDCTLCKELFILDVEVHWRTPPDEMETLGREFLGLHSDAALCPHCLHQVELTGAERIYWRLAHC